MLSSDIEFIFDYMSYFTPCIFNWIALYFNILLFASGPLVLVFSRIGLPGFDYLLQWTLVLITSTGTIAAMAQFIAVNVSADTPVHSCGVRKPYLKGLYINHQKRHLQ